MAIIAVLVLLCPVVGQSAEQKTAAQIKHTEPVTASAPADTSAIPVSDIAAQAIETTSLIETIKRKLAPEPQIGMIRQMLPDHRRQIDEDLTATMEMLQQSLPLSVLQTKQQQWQQMQLKNTGWLEELTKKSNSLQEALSQMTRLQKTWEMTLNAARLSRAPGHILQQAGQQIETIKSAQLPLQEQLASVLDLQSRVSDEAAKCGTVLARITEVQTISMTGILVQDSLPIATPELWANALSGLADRFGSIAAAYSSDIRKYIQDPSEHMPLHAGLFAVLALLFLIFRHRVRKWSEAGESISPSLRVFNNPFAASLTMSLIVATSPHWRTPSIIQGTLQVLNFAPMIVLIRPVISARLFPGLYLLWSLFAVDALREAFSSELPGGQALLVLESLAGLIMTALFMRRFRPTFADNTGAYRAGLINAGAFIVILIFALGAATAAAGYLRLARLLTPGILAGGSLALVLYAAVRVFTGIADIALHVWPLCNLRMVKHNRALIERRLYLFFIWAAITGWIARYLGYIGVLDPLLSYGKILLSAKLERGPISISLGDVLEFFLTIYVAYLLSGFIRFVLREDIFPRLNTTSGKSYALSSLLHYFIVAAGFTVAIAALGVNLTKLTVLTGAFGVGIGFGLQSVVNNFVSGLILLMERPIHVGDTIEVGELMGKVRLIGIRASTVLTRQGADIVVPNSLLVSDKVTNWTLSNNLRRIDLPVGVNYGAAPKEVIKVLEDVANAHPQVLKDPAPQGLCTGFGESSINFELRAWPNQFDEWRRIRSDLAIAVYDAVHAAGMTFPSPQRDVRLLLDTRGCNAEGGNSVNEL